MSSGCWRVYHDKPATPLDLFTGPGYQRYTEPCGKCNIDSIRTAQAQTGCQVCRGRCNLLVERQKVQLRNRRQPFDCELPTRRIIRSASYGTRNLDAQQHRCDQDLAGEEVLT